MALIGPNNSALPLVVIHPISRRYVNGPIIPVVLEGCFNKHDRLSDWAIDHSGRPYVQIAWDDGPSASRTVRRAH